MQHVIRTAAIGNITHIPDDQVAGIEIGRGDIKTPAFRVLCSNFRQQICIDKIRDLLLQRAVIVERFTEKTRSGPVDVLILGRRIEPFQVIIIFRTLENAPTAIRAPVETPVTTSNSGRVPESDQPFRTPAP